MAWRPGQHQKRLELEEPYEDVPDHLRASLLTWVGAVFAQNATRLNIAIVHLRLPYGDPRLDRGAHRQVFDMLMVDADRDAELLLNLVEVALKMTDVGHKNELASILAIGNSAYRVRSDGLGLEMYVMPEAKQAVEDTVRVAASTSASAAEHLANAWNLAYGRTPDADKAYDQAIKAVEAAAIPLVCPNHATATLGNVIGELKHNTDRWRFAIADGRTGASVERVVGMLSLLWEGDEDRHGGVGDTPVVAPESARTAVHLAATLVQWFVSGAVSKKEAD